MFLLLEEESKGNRENIFSNDDWIKILSCQSQSLFYDIDRKKLIQSLMTGIPKNLRGNIWKFLSKTQNVYLNYDKNFFKNLLTIKNLEVEMSIKKDIERTTLFFEGISEGDYEKIDSKINNAKFLKNNKNKLYDVLKAYSVYDPKVGYCQGTNFIAMLIMSNLKSSTEAFWIFVQIMHEKNWRNLFIENTPKLMKVMEKLVKNIKIKIKDLFDHFNSQEVKYIFLNFIQF
jgi:hypothetical protein